jgi:HEAT repeat protein
MDCETALEFVNYVVAQNVGRHLTDAEFVILKGIWSGATYQEMESSSQYSANYLGRDVAQGLRKTLSEIFQEKVSKSNLRTVIQRHYSNRASQLSQEKSTSLLHISELEWASYRSQYLRQLAERIDDVKFVGISVPGEEVKKQEILAQIFVMPNVRQVHSELSIPAFKVLDFAQKKAVLLAAPGSGKTLLVNYFALMLCGTAQSDPTQIGLEKDNDYLPVVVRIRDWILESKMGLLEYLRSNAEANLACKKLPAGFFEHWLERGRALILLDGLDEVVDEAQRRKVAEQIETFLHQYQDNPAVITSRAAGYRWDFFNLDEFPHYMLESFDDKQVATFIDHWYDSRLKDDKAQAERRKADLQKAFARNERIRLLAKNPLLLTIITLIHRYQAELPRQRCKLYEKAVETLLTSWDSGKEIKLYSQVLLFLKSDDLLYILKKLAYWIHTQGSTGETEGGTLIDKDELMRWLRIKIQALKKCEAHEAKGEAERFIDFIQRRTGLLNEQGRDRYAFVHKTFQEYLTAEEIFDRADVADDTEIILDHFRQHLHDQHWREVLLLLVSKLKGKKAQKAIQAVLDAGSEYEQWLHRDLLFAGWCLTEDPPELSVVAADLVREILDRLVDLEVGDSDLVGGKIRGEVEKILHCFGETSIEQEVWLKLQAEGEQIGIFRLVEFQADLGQEADAIDKWCCFLSEKNSDVRFRAAMALRRIGNVSPAVVNRLKALLADKVVTVRYYALETLCKSGNVNTNDLLPLLSDKYPDISYRAAETLSKLGDANLEAVNRLLSLLGSENSEVRSNAAQALGGLGNTSLDVINNLRQLLFDLDPTVRFCSAKALGELGNASSEVISSLLSLCGDKQDSAVRFQAAIALGKLGNASSEVINGLLSLLGDENSTVRFHAATALGILGNTSSGVVNGLRSLLSDKKSSSCGAAALVKLGDTGSEMVSILLSLLSHEDSMTRRNAALTLGEIGNVSSEGIDVLVLLLGDENYLVRSSIPEVLVQLAKTSDTIRPKVLQWLEQNLNHDGIGSAIDCLWSIVVE